MGCANGKKYAEPVSPPAKKSSSEPDLEKRPSRVQFMDAAQVIDEKKGKVEGHAAVEKKAHLEHTHSQDGTVVKRKNVTAMVKASDLPPDDDDEDEEEGEYDAEPAAAGEAAPTSVVPTPAAPKKPADPNAKVHIAEESTSVRRTEVDRAIRGEDGGDDEEGAEETADAKTPKNPKKRIPTQCGAKLGAFNMDDEDDEDEEEGDEWAGAEEAEEAAPAAEGAGPEVKDQT